MNSRLILEKYKMNMKTRRKQQMVLRLNTKKSLLNKKMNMKLKYQS